MKVRKAVIPAAGLGTRFLPATKAMPKEMLPIVDKPIIQYVVEEAVSTGIEDILIITGRGKRAIEDHFDRSIELEYYLQAASPGSILQDMKRISTMANVHFIRQQEPRGLGHAVLQARQHVGNEPFAVLLGDEIFSGERPCLQELVEQYEQWGGGGMVAVRQVSRDQVHRYGIVDGEQLQGRTFRVRGMVEKPSPEHAPSNLSIVGRYILSSDIFDVLAATPPGYGGEIQLTDALNQLAQTESVYACETDAHRYDVGDKLGYIQATLELGLSRSDLGPAVEAYLHELIARRSQVAAARGH